MLNYKYLVKLELRKKFPGLVGVVGTAENKANSAPIELELELRLSLAKPQDLLQECEDASL